MTDIRALIFDANLPLAEVVRATGQTLYYVVGFHVGFSGSWDAIDILPAPSGSESTDIAEFGLGKLAGQHARRAWQDEQPTEITRKECQ